MKGININKGIQVGINLVETISAREVFNELGGHPGSFTGWINYRIKKHGYKLNVDYTTSVNDAYYGQKDYHVTVAMAATIARDGGYKNTEAVTSYLESLLPAKADVAPARVAVFTVPEHLNSVKTMSSVEIVEVINQLRGPDKAELRHADFMTKVARHPGIAERNFSGFYLGGNGKQEPCYYLPKREAELMVMSESLEVQTQVYDRLTELEAATVPKLPQTYAQALMELALNVQRTEALQLENAQKATQIEQQSMLIETQKPAVEFVDKYVETDGTMNFRTLAKLLGAPEADFRNFLSDNKYRFREGAKWTHYKKWGDGLGNAGYFTMKVGVSPSSGLAYQQSYFTPKGIEFFTRKWAERAGRAPVLTRKAGPMPPLPLGIH